MIKIFYFIWFFFITYSSFPEEIDLSKDDVTYINSKNIFFDNEENKVILGKDSYINNDEVTIVANGGNIDFKNDKINIENKFYILQINEIFSQQRQNSQKQIEIDLINQQIKIPNIKLIDFEIDEFRKNCLLEGLDDIGFSLKYESEITNYENKIKKLRPWILND